MRIFVLYVLVLFLAVYAYRDWFRSLCGCILLMAVVEHPDFPTAVGGVQGMNPWNLAFANVVIAWARARRREGLVWDLPPYLGRMLLIYLFVILAGFLRCVLDPGQITGHTLGDLFSEQLINTLKWPLPGLLLFDGCRARKRLNWAIISILGLYFLLAVQVVRWMAPAAGMGGAALTVLARKIIMNEVGLHPINLSMMLAGAFWATLATVALVRKTWQRIAVVAAALLMAYGQALTGGRMGYVTWGVVGLVFGLLRWRKSLLLAPVLVLIIATVVPSAVERMLQGFGERTASADNVTNDYEVTSGRTLIWPYVVEKIMAEPAFGYGRLAMNRTGVSDRLMRELGEAFPHPHNAYLEWLFDNGVAGFLLVMPLYAVILAQSLVLFRSRAGPAYAAVGGISLALVLALLVAALGSQTFYPREGAVGMWAAIGLMWRMTVQRERLTSPRPVPASAWAPAASGAA
jgi:O-antigen ligase